VRRTTTVTEVLRRGFDSVLANWPLLLMRIAESMLIAAIAVAAAIALIVPVVVSIGLTKIDLRNVDDPGELMRSILFDHWVIIVYVLAGITALLVVFVALHSFVQGGAAEILVAAERQGGDDPVPRQRLEAFTMDRWLRGAARTWWSIFWIYNVAWGLGGLIMLAPLFVIAVVLLLSRGNPAAIVLSCFGLVLTVFIVLIISVIVGIWTQKAIVVVAARPAGASEALADGWREIRSDFTRHFGVAFVIFVIAVGLAGVMGMLSVSLGFSRSAGAQFLFLPVRIGISFVNTFLSAAIGNWLLASFAALTVSRVERL
jgi:hypothetical protein